MAKKSDEKTLMKLSTVKKSAKDIIIDKGAHVNKEENAPFEEDSKKEIDNTIENSVFLLNSGETVVKDNPKTIATLLSTTESNAHYISKRNFQDKDKINFNTPINSEENIEEKGIKTQAIIYEIRNRTEGNITSEQRENLEYASISLSAIESSKEVRFQKCIGLAQCNKIDAKNKEEKRKNAEFDEITGENFKENEEIDIHHINARARVPAKEYIKPDNYAALKKSTHKTGHKKDGAFEDPTLVTFEEQKEKVLEDLKKEKK